MFRIEAKIGGSDKLKDQCPVLFHLLQEGDVLEEVCHLPGLLQLGNFMISKFNRKLDSSNTDAMTIETFLLNHLETSDRLTVKPLVNVYFSVLNKVRNRLFSHNWQVVFTLMWSWLNFFASSVIKYGSNTACFAYFCSFKPNVKTNIAQI